MIRKVTIIFFFMCGLNMLHAQNNIAKRLSEIWYLFDEQKIEEACSAINFIESKCLKTKNDTLLAQFYCYKGWGLFHTKQYAECIPYLKQACSLFEKTNNRHDDYISCYSLIAIAYQNLQNYSEAERYYRKTVIKCHSHSISEPLKLTSSLYIHLADMYSVQGDTIMEKIADSVIHSIIEYGEWKNTMWDSINKYRDSRQYDKSIEYLKSLALGILENEGITTEYILAQYSEGLDLRVLQRYEEAKLVFENIIYHRFELNRLDANVCGAYCNYCYCLTTEGDYEQIERILPGAIQYIGLTQDTNFIINSIYRYIGNGAFWTQDYRNAIKYYEEYLDSKYERELGNSYDEITCMLSTAYAYYDMNIKIISLLKNYLKKNEKRVRLTNPHILLIAYDNLGSALALEKRYKEALKYLNESKKLQVELKGNVSDVTQSYIDLCNKLK